MTYTPTKLLSLEEFITQYADNTRYELIDGELRDMEPTGLHEAVAGSIAGRIYVEVFNSNLNWLVPKTCLIKPPAAAATALRSDVVVLDQVELTKEPLWQKEPIICNGSTIKLVAEVVSTNWQDDYARKVEEYAFLNILEYWIVDFRALGGLQFIGNPEQPTFTICHLVNGVYEQQQYRALLNYGMKSQVLKYSTPYSLCAFAPLRETIHPAFMQPPISIRRDYLILSVAEFTDET